MEIKKLIGTIEENNIFQLDGVGNKTCVGVVANEFTAMKKTAEMAVEQLEEAVAERDELKTKNKEYLDILIANKLIEIPKTQEEINSELMKTNQELMTSLLKLNEKMEAIENGFKQNTGNGESGGTGQNKNHGSSTNRK